MPSGSLAWITMCTMLLLLLSPEQTASSLKVAQHGAEAGRGGHTMCLITMVKNEHDKFASWVPYYLGEGADFIYVIDDRSDPPLAFDHPNVRIDHIDGLTYQPHPRMFKPAAKQSMIIEEGIEKVIFQHDCKWTISVDVDEFVTTYRNEQRTVKEELEKSFAPHSVVDVPWVSMAYDRPVHNVLFDMVYRWNHDLPHFQKRQATVSKQKKMGYTFTKPIFRSDQKCHLTGLVHKAGCKGRFSQVDSVTKLRNTPPVYTLNETKLKKALLLIFHYRYTGEANLREKCQPKQSLMEGYYFDSVDRCMADLRRLNSPDLFDPIMVRRWNRRHGTNITVTEHPAPSSP